MDNYLYTEEEYTSLICAVLKTWRPVFYEDALSGERLVLWRHDVDYSPQRALALARIEAAHGMRATYFFQLRSLFYNLLEPGMDRLIREIVRLGHRIGLHFDPAPYAETHGQDAGPLADCISLEKRILEECFSVRVNALSFHNPTVVSSGIDRRANRIAGMINADGLSLKEGYTYISDSRGGWRREDLPLRVREKSINNLHVLTHPVRWTPTPLSVEGMLYRHVEGHADNLRGILARTAKYWEKPIDESQDHLFCSRTDRPRNGCSK